ncbi:HD family phosphohydrolase [Rubrivirga sp.]|uniref:HD family phosphohydrolase n=1 Tax=Rubrivirga sp. TaxID=1885344 RepID=UPI003B522067
MSFLDRLGLSPKSGRYSRRAGLRTDRRSDRETPKMAPREVAARVGLFAALAVLALLAFPNVAVYDGTARVGDVWQSDDVVAPFDFSIRLPDQEIRSRRDSVLASESPIFRQRPEALAQTLARLDSVDARLDSAFVAYVDWRRTRDRLDQALTADPDADAPADPDGVRAALRRDSLRYVAQRGSISLSLSPRQWQLLLASAYDVATGQRSGPTLDDQLLGEASRISRELLARGVLDVPIDSVRSPTLLVQDLEQRSEMERRRSDVVGVDQAAVLARRSLFAAFPNRPDTVGIGAALFASSLDPSLVYDAEATQRKRDQTLRSVLPTRGRVRESQIIIRRYDEVTEERFEMLQSLDYAQRERSGDNSWLTTVLGRSILVFSAIALFFLYTYLLRPAIFADLRQFTLACIVLGAAIAGFLIAGAFGGAAPYAVPVSLASILLTIVFDSRVGSFATMTLAAIGGLAFGYDFPYTFATLIVGVLAVFSVRDVKNRSQILASAGLVFLAYVLVLVGHELLRADPFSNLFWADVVAVAVNAALILLAAPVLWGMEKVFGVTTDMTLLELSDTNRTLLKKLSMQAPGTFNHSLQVANLAEAAADAIGANALRARVGALYHDIGKMLKPEYFIENQQPGENPHEKLKPSMSALVIAAHVKEGVQLGKEQNLPEVVVDFIASHHGTGLIEFFYRKAQEAEEDPDVVDESDYRYPGPRPQTNEQAIVMLADSVEAASRSLGKPTPRRLESLIDGIVAARVADGQLDESTLTFADLARIKETFHALLCGIYHFRVKYPDQEDEPAGDGASENLETTPDPVTDTTPDESVPTSEERSTMG